MLKRRPFSETMNKFTLRIIYNIKKVDILFSEWGRQFYARPVAQKCPALACCHIQIKCIVTCQFGKL